MTAPLIYFHSDFAPKQVNKSGIEIYAVLYYGLRILRLIDKSHNGSHVSAMKGVPLTGSLLYEKRNSLAPPAHSGIIRQGSGGCVSGGFTQA